MTDIIEKAARAIEDRFVEVADPDGPLSPYGMAEDVVRAVLQAIREPNDEMLPDSFRSVDDQVYQASHLLGDLADDPKAAFTEIWQAMIDSALGER